MAEEIQYISENGRLYLNETREVRDSLCDKLEQLGAHRVEDTLVKRGRIFDFKGIYEFPRKGSVFFHFKQIADDYVETPDDFTYNVKVNLLGFEEETEKYKTIKSSIEGVLNVEHFDKKK